jgi:hypothetical protein
MSNLQQSTEDCMNLEAFLMNSLTQNRIGSGYQLLDLETENGVEKREKRRD